jgi:Skp family chaperone for outer membrane proteins
VTALGVAFLAGATAINQKAAGAGATGTGKMGVIDVQSAIGSTAEGKQAFEELQSLFASRRSELDCDQQANR